MTKRQSFERHNSASKRSGTGNSKVKSVSYIVFECKRVVHKEILPPGETVVAARYVIVPETVQRRVCRFLEADNVPSHIAFVVADYLVKRSVFRADPQSSRGTSFSSPTTQTGYVKGPIQAVRVEGVHSGFCVRGDLP